MGSIPIAFAALGISLSAAPSLQKPATGHPKITVRSTPAIATAPAKILAVAELVGGADDDRDFYCPRVEWTWDDETTSDKQEDCDPYTAGKSEIERRYSAEHRYDLSGIYTVTVRFWQGKTVVGTNRMTVRITADHAPLTRPTSAATPWLSLRGF